MMRPGSSAARAQAALLRNRPSRKPQLWEDFGLSARRRVQFELRRRWSAGWMDRPVTIQLSRTGFAAPDAPIQICIRPRDMSQQSMFLYGVFEISETRLVQALLRPGMVFFDVGANIGYYSLIGSHLVGPTGAVHAFEPNAAVRERLDENIRLNGLTNVQVHVEAVSDRRGEVTFYESSMDDNQGVSSLLPADFRSSGTTVPATTLDDLSAQLGGRAIDLIKMDVEGAEPMAIEGGRNLFSGPAAPHLIFEAREVAPLEQQLGAFGYQIRRIQYTLQTGLELPRPDSPVRSIFEDYEAPNYLAAKDPAVFEAAVQRANERRPRLLRLLGRI
jgi:FkbM family methyltransferase